MAQIEEHSFRKFTGHFTWFEIHDEQSLLALDLVGIFAFFANPRENRADVVARIHGEAHQIVGSIGAGAGMAIHHLR